MFTVYIYVLDTLADWELGYVTAELNSGRFFKKGAPEVLVETVALSKEPVKTMGGLTIVPDCSISDIEMGEKMYCCCLGRTHGTTRSIEPLLKKPVSFFLRGLWCVLSVGLPLHWQTLACWISARTQVMEPDTLKWFLPAIRDRSSLLTHHLWQIVI